MLKTAFGFRFGGFPRDHWLLVPSLIEGLRVVQGLRVVLVFLYRYSMKSSLKKAGSPGTTEGGRSD
jgi:hypothetical protein